MHEQGPCRTSTTSSSCFFWLLLCDWTNDDPSSVVRGVVGSPSPFILYWMANVFPSSWEGTTLLSPLWSQYQLFNNMCPCIQITSRQHHSTKFFVSTREKERERKREWEWEKGRESRETILLYRWSNTVIVQWESKKHCCVCVCVCVCVFVRKNIPKRKINNNIKSSLDTTR